MPGASISKLASVRMRKYSPKRRCFRRSAPASMRACTRNRPGIIRSRKWCWWGRSALLLSKAKDNNASCAIGPFVRFFDKNFTLDDVRKMEISLEVKGPEGFVLHGASSLSQISRDPADIVGQTINENHQYPDGFVLFLGTMFAPIQDRAAKGQGFTHV